MPLRTEFYASRILVKYIDLDSVTYVVLACVKYVYKGYLLFLYTQQARKKNTLTTLLKYDSRCTLH
jgi:hypothetical protein